MQRGKHMIKLIVGPKGSGKTKRMLELVNQTAETSKGNVVLLEKVCNIAPYVNHKAKTIVTDEYDISNWEELRYFLYGIVEGNRDVTDIFVDTTFKIVQNTVSLPFSMYIFFLELSELCETRDIQFTFSLSCQKEEIPQDFFKYCEII